MTLSRTPLVGISVALLLSLIFIVVIKKKETLGRVFSHFCFLIHGFFYYLLKFSLLSLKQNLSNLTRYYLHVIYTLIGLKTTFGTGLGNGILGFQKHMSEFQEHFVHKVGIDYIHINEQHSVIVQSISEFGVIGYLLFSYFLFKILKRTQNSSHKLTILFLSVISMSMVINVFNEVALYLIFAICLSKVSQEEGLIDKKSKDLK